MPEHMRVMCSLTPAERQCLAYSHNGIAHVAFDHMHSLRFRDVTISWLNHTPHASAVYASCSASLPPHATLASQAARGLTWAFIPIEIIGLFGRSSSIRQVRGTSTGVCGV